MNWLKASKAKDSDKILYDGDWHKIKETPDGYAYIINKKGVAILPYRDEGNNREFLIRDEENPLFDNYITLITGRLDENEEPIDAAIRELNEEAGLDIKDKSKIENVGNMIISKDHINKEVLFVVDVTGIEQKEPETDGTVYEAQSKNFWVSEDEFKKYVLDSDDAYMAVVAAKMFLNEMN